MLFHKAVEAPLDGVSLSSWTNPSTSSSLDQIPSSSVTKTFTFTPTLFNKHHTEHLPVKNSLKPDKPKTSPSHRLTAMRKKPIPNESHTQNEKDNFHFRAHSTAYRETCAPKTTFVYIENDFRSDGPTLLTGSNKHSLDVDQRTSLLSVKLNKVYSLHLLTRRKRQKQR